jgi:GxxExxY protein
MHEKYERANKLSHEAIGGAIEVHRLKGPGLLEEIYEKCLMREFEIRGIPAKSQIPISLEYKGMKCEQILRLDAIIDDCLLIELKAVERILPIHKAQLFSYMKLLDVPIGLLINFHEPVLKQGISRLMLPNANIPDVDF